MMGPQSLRIGFLVFGCTENGDFRSTGAISNGYLETLIPGIPGNVVPNNNQYNNYASEILAYVEFPTNGTYILGVSSDDGFRLTRGFNPPTNNGALVVNSPPSVAGKKRTALSSFLTSTPLTNTITGNLFFPNGISFLQGSTTNGEGCVITDPFGSTSGKILIMFRSLFCSYAQQVGNAAAAGAIAAIIINTGTNTSGANNNNAPYPEVITVAPPQQPIPAIDISQADGRALVAALANNTVTVNVTLTPMQDTVNPAPGVGGPLGQADFGKGASDVLFPVVVQQAGVYPLRLLYFQGGGDANCEFFSLTASNRVLINDLTVTTGPGPGGTGLRAFFPIVNLSIAYSGGNAVITFGGKLQSAPTVLGPWTDVLAATSSPFTTPASSAAAFYRSVLLN